MQKESKKRKTMTMQLLFHADDEKETMVYDFLSTLGKKKTSTITECVFEKITSEKEKNNSKNEIIEKIFSDEDFLKDFSKKIIEFVNSDQKSKEEEKTYEDTKEKTYQEEETQKNNETINISLLKAGMKTFLQQ